MRDRTSPFRFMHLHVSCFLCTQSMKMWLSYFERCSIRPTSGDSLGIFENRWNNKGDFNI
jgi:hypothetical protein